MLTDRADGSSQPRSPRVVAFAPGESTALIRRVRTSLVFVPLLVGIAWPGGWVFAAFVSLVSVLALLELWGMTTRLGRPAWRAITIPAGAALPIAMHLFGLPRVLGWPIVATVLLSILLRRRGGAIGRLASSVLSVAYVPFLLGHLVLLRDGDATGGVLGLESVLFLFLVTWACDTFAYVVGRATGRHRLWPRVSPNKTVEGALGGVLAALVTALAMRPLALPSLSVPETLALALVLGVVLQGGDLFESRLKRKARVKDSSALLPGHGGLLDRFDSMIAGAPAAYHLLRLF